MANHVRRQLREAIATALTGLTTTGTRVFQSRSYPLTADDLPGLRISTPSDEAQLVVINAPVYERATLIVVEGVAAANTDLDDTLDAIAKEVEVALAAGVTIGSKTIAITYDGCESEFDTEGETPRGQVSLRFTADLFTAAATPDVFS